MLKKILRLAAMLGVMGSSQLSAQNFTSADVIRLNNGQPIIDQQMFAQRGVASEGENINGPCLIRVPDWISSQDRADPRANYYLYFGHHVGDYIRMAWAENVTGPWTLYDTGANVPLGDRGVLDNAGQDIAIGDDIVIGENHLASPDVHVDNVNQRIIMYFHSGSSTFLRGNPNNAQVSWVSTSSDGLEFFPNIEPVVLGPSYFRVFEHGNFIYAFDNSGFPRRARDTQNPWRPTPNYYSSETIQALWERHPDNLYGDRIQDLLGLSRSELRVRHTGVHLVGDRLNVFFTQRGDSPERVMVSTIDLSGGNWLNWNPTYPPETLLTPVSGWEGGQFDAEPSQGGAAQENVNELRDPYVFEDNDGSLYLIYTGRGEDALGIAALSSENQEIRSFSPIQDSYVRSGSNADTNFGQSNELEVREASAVNSVRESYLQFNLSSVENVESAVIRLYSTRDRSANITISGAGNSNWSENSITYNNAPSIGDSISTVLLGPVNTWYEWDVTEYVKSNEGRSRVSFALQSESNSPRIVFSSSEGDFAPELKILTKEPPSGGPRIVTMRKRNASGFAIDGNSGEFNGRNVHLWSFSSSNTNQQWEEIDRGGGFYSYQKLGTNFSLDGGNGGANRQNVYLWQTGANNVNQHWRKVSVGGGAFQLIKRNTNFAINGGGGGERGQNVNLFDASVNSQNLHWIIE